MENHNYSNPYLQIVPASPNVQNGGGKRSMDGIYETFHKYGKRVEEATKKAETYADNFWNHVRTGPSLTDVAMVRITQGTKVIAEGGYDRLFLQTFGTLPGEKLLNAYVCYLSTSSGPIAGTLYVSTQKVAFCSDCPISYNSSPGGRQQWMYYKVVVPLDKITSVNPSSNKMKPSEKYIQIVTKDGHEFWYMGFISYDKALKHLGEALHVSRNSSIEVKLEL